MRRVWTGAAAAVLALCVAAPAGAATSTPTPWMRQLVPFPSAGAHGALYGVSCVSATECMAVGTFGKSGSGRHLLAEHWDGSTWSAKEVPSPYGTFLSEFDGVSCASATNCVAVGYANVDGDYMPLAARWNGTRWSAQAISLPSGESGELDAVSCASTTRCTAVGRMLSSSTTAVTLSEQWNGHTWSMQSTPNPAGSTYAYLTAVSCALATSCTAVGGSNSSGTGTFAEQWDGTSWTITSTVDPAGVIDDTLSGISCSAAASCTAVGSYDTPTTGAESLMLAEHWDGSAWSLEPTPTGVDTDGLEGVSCTSATWCTAVGITADSNGAALAEVWDGSMWTTQTTATPANRNYFLGISCTAVNSCTAVGGSAGAPPGFTPLLAEQE